MSASLHVSLFCALASFAPTQGRTWIVDSRGGGDFLQVGEAIVAASPGDRLEVRGPGPYLGFTLTKALDVDAV